MTRFLRRLFGFDEKRGTLTFLIDGTVILGLPRDLDMREVDGVRRQMTEWLTKGADWRALVLPFPVEVVDERKRVTA